jgi:hypothetical protein
VKYREERTHFCNPSLLEDKLSFLLSYLLEDEFFMHSDLGEAFFFLCMVLLDSA